MNWHTPRITRKERKTKPRLNGDIGYETSVVAWKSVLGANEKGNGKSRSERTSGVAVEEVEGRKGRANRTVNPLRKTSHWGSTLDIK